MAETLDELVVKIKADASNLEKEMAQIRSKINKESKEYSERLNIKAKFDNSIAKLKISELQTYRQKLQTLFDKQLKMNVDVASISRTKERLASVDQQLQGISKSASPLSKIFGGIGASIGAAFATAGIVRFGFEAVTLAGKVEGVKTAFNNLNQPGLLEKLREATRNTISDFELMKVAMRASNFKIPLTELGTLLEFAQKRASQTGQEVDYLVNSIIDGIGRKSTLVLDNLGISATELQTEFAKTGDFGKATANIISREMQNMGEVIDTSATKLAQLNAQLENQKVEIGNQLTPIWSGLLKVLSGGLTLLGLMGQEFKRIVSPARAYGDIISELTIKHQQYARMLEQTYTSQAKLSSFIISTYKQQRDTIGQINQRISDLTAAQDNLVYGSAEYLKNVKEIEKLEKSIGLGKQTSGGTDYIKELQNSLDNYRNKIKLLNAELAKLGDGSSEKKVILTAELSKLQEQLNNEEIKLNLKVGKVDLEGGDIDTEGLMKEFAAETNTNIIAGLQENLDLRLKARQEYIDAVGLLNEKAFNDSKAMIDKEYEIFIASGVAQEEAQAIHDEKMKELRDARQEEENAILDAQLANMAVMENSLGGFAALAQQLGGEQSTAYKLFAISQATIATYLAATKALAEVPFPFNFAAAAGVVAAGLANVAQITSAHYGGEFVGTSSGIRKMAAGGSFIVPNGFPNDSYPMLVESGERVSVTPAGSVGSQDRLLSEISNRLKTLEVLNKNLISKNFSPVIVNSLELDGRKITKSVVSNINKMQREGQDLSY
ncbi:MAG TPA: hypothetical protein DHV28_17645 [Ignavibacteriales bacterium]|nr:hypothetical protein [Ignavibacteriales bacterium]